MKQHEFLKILWVLLFATGGVALHSQETVIHRYDSSTPDDRIENILYLATGVAFSEHGLSSTRSDSTPHEFVLSTEYTLVNGVLSLQFTFFRKSHPDSMYLEDSLVTPLDLDMDQRVSAAIRDMLQQIADVTDPPTPPGEPIIEGILSPQITAPPRTPPDPSQPETPTPTREEPQLVTGPEYAIGPTALVLVGEVTDLFRYGGGGSFAAGYNWPWSRFSILLGGRVNVMRLVAADHVSGGTLVLTTVGTDLQVSTPFRRPVRVGLRATPGVTAVSVLDSETNPLAKVPMTKMVPSIKTTVTTRLAIGDSWSIGGDGGFFAAFEESYVIMGVVASFVVSLDL